MVNEEEKKEKKLETQMKQLAKLPEALKDTCKRVQNAKDLIFCSKGLRTVSIEDKLAMREMLVGILESSAHAVEELDEDITIHHEQDWNEHMIKLYRQKELAKTPEPKLMDGK